jgi:hypothetical protein
MSHAETDTAKIVTLRQTGRMSAMGRKRTFQRLKGRAPSGLLLNCPGGVAASLLAGFDLALICWLGGPAVLP